MQIKRIVVMLLSACVATVSYNSMAMNNSDSNSVSLLVNDPNCTNETNKNDSNNNGSSQNDVVLPVREDNNNSANLRLSPGERCCADCCCITLGCCSIPCFKLACELLCAAAAI